jgi:hypothetical protein
MLDFLCRAGMSKAGRGVMQPRIRNRRGRNGHAYGLETLESRVLLSAANVLPLMTAAPSSTQLQATLLQPTYQVLSAPGSLAPLQTAGVEGYTPAEIRTAYGLNQVTFGSTAGTGAGQTIAIIDAYNDPDIASDLHAFDLTFGLADPTLKVVSQTGSSTLPGVDPVGPGGSNFEGEEALDVEWAHALAPGATIMLVEANDASPSNLFAAANFARQQSGVSVISMSFGGDETGSETQYDSIFTTPAGHEGVTFIASTGDSGTPAGYPAYSPNVVAAGGSSLSLDSNGNYLSEIAWNGSGGGISQVESQPSYQSGVVTQSHTFRTAPDVAFDADPETGVAVYDSYNNGSSTPWEVLGGTSVAAPSWAGIIAVVDQGRVLAGKGTLDSRTATLPLLYGAPAADFHDITSGNNGLPASAGYDLVTGRGSPRANLLIPYMVTGVITLPPPVNGPTIASITASATTVTEGTSVTLTAEGVSDPGGTGLAVTFYEETNGVAGLQTGSGGDSAFTPVTDGTNAILLDTSNVTGTFTFYAQLTDSSGAASPTGTSAPSVVIDVVAASSQGPSIASISGAPNPVVSGDTLTLTANGITDPSASVRRVTFYEETNGEPGLQTGFNGDFAFRSTSSSSGFTLNLDTSGVTGSFTFYGLASDNLGNTSATGTAAPSTTIDVVSGSPPDAPANLTATAVSATEIDLAFTETDSGQTGFNIERSLVPNFATFTTVFSINRPDAITYSDTGLAPGTTYYYRVQAVDLAGDSGFSNIASATTGIAPTGSFRDVNATEIAGWAFDDNTPGAAVTVQIDVDGAQVGTATASGDRPDLLPVVGSADHGFTYTLPALSVGLHLVDVYALDTTTAAPTLLGTLEIDTNNAPIGSVGAFNGNLLKGWAFDANAGSAAIQIRYQIDGNAPELATASVSRSDLVPVVGSADHGFAVTLPQLRSGLHAVTVWAVDSTSESLTLLGTVRTTIPNPAGDPLPEGAVGLLTTSEVKGWAFDALTPTAPIAVRVDVDGVAGTPVLANGNRPDLVPVVGGADFGFLIPLSLSAGAHRVAVYAIESDTGIPLLLDSQVVGDPTPIGSIGPITTSVQGWAHSAGLAGGPSTVRLDIDGQPGATVVANINRPDLVPVIGASDFGYFIALPTLPAGTHTLQLWVIDPLTLNQILIGSEAFVTI